MYLLGFLFTCSIRTVLPAWISAENCTLELGSCPNPNVTFYLYTKLTKDDPHKLDVNQPRTILNAFFIPDAPIKILIHGYTGHRDYSPNMEIRPAYLRSDLVVNVISVDYHELVHDGCYLESVRNLPVAARCTSQLIETILNLREDIKLAQFHIIGFSLGAQLAGQIVNYFQRGVFERITGLDPALPLFFGNIVPQSLLLDKNDAKFVDIIHTNAGIKGKYFPVGHVDFYANSGTFQAGCGYNHSCSHVRAPEFYAESISSNVGFWGFPCLSVYDYLFGRCTEKSNMIRFGEHISHNARGIYFFDTRSEPPFALGKLW